MRLDVNIIPGENPGERDLQVANEAQHKAAQQTLQSGKELFPLPESVTLLITAINDPNWPEDKRESERKELNAVFVRANIRGASLRLRNDLKVVVHFGEGVEMEPAEVYAELMVLMDRILNEKKDEAKAPAAQTFVVATGQEVSEDDAAQLLFDADEADPIRKPLKLKDTSAEDATSSETVVLEGDTNHGEEGETDQGSDVPTIKKQLTVAEDKARRGVNKGDDKIGDNSQEAANYGLQNLFGRRRR